MKIGNNALVEIEMEFSKKTVWSLIFSAKEGTDFVSGKSRQSEDTLYDKMIKNVSAKLKEYDATLKEVFVSIGSENKKLDMSSAKELMMKVILLDLPLIFRVQIENKNYDYQVK